MTGLTLAPYPRQLERTGGTLLFPREGTITLADRTLYPEAEMLRACLSQAGYAYALRVAETPRGTLHLGWEATLPAEGYRLTVDDEGVVILGGDAAGVFYGTATLRQLVLNADASGALPQLVIDDAPDFAERAYMLDVSRDRVPRLDALLQWVDELAALKINQLQLYVEHTFAYPGHEIVWSLADPLTPEDILRLDAYCRARHIELVPNQNSLGHMERWLKHAPYRHLAESPDGFQGPAGRWRGPSTLAPLEPASLALMRELYDALLPHFSSRRVNVGCDEPWELGRGKSQQAVAQRGGRVYLDWLLSLHAMLSVRGYQTLFWGDMVNQHPELIPHLPRDLVVLEWGYEAHHPFRERAQTYALHDIPFYVCPGTSSWNALLGRVDNMRDNIRHAVEAGLEQGALGCLLTDWGDNGHWQAPLSAYPGLVYGAAMMWGAANNRELDLAAALNRLIFRDATGHLGEVMLEAGQLYQLTGPAHVNGSTLAYALQWPLDEIATRLEQIATLGGAQPDVSPRTLRGVMAMLDGWHERLSASRPQRSDGALLLREWAQMLHLTRHGAAWLLRHQNADDVPVAQRLREWEGLMAQQRELWLARSRRGGLDDSLRRFETLRRGYLSL